MTGKEGPDWTFSYNLLKASNVGLYLNFQGVPSAVVFTYDIKDDEIILKWKQTDDNGAAITLYTIYQRIENDERWEKIGTITDISKLEYVVKVEKGKEYEFVVTATNKYGEYPKKDNIKKVKVPGGRCSCALQIAKVV